MKFSVDKKINNVLGRAGVLSTPHGVIQTPAFVAVGTKATVKSLTPEQIKEAGSQVVLANTYHLYLEPGEKIVKEAGGLGKFMNWQGPTFTDSGGFQAFSLGVAYGNKLGKFISSDTPEEEIIEEIKDPHKTEKKAKVTEEGVEFVSVLDGSKRFLSPEKSMQVQADIGADMIFALDEFTSPHANKEKIEETIDRTFRWAGRCLKEHGELRKIISQKVLALPAIATHGRTDISSKQFSLAQEQALFGIVQGGRYQDLREKSAKQISSLDFDGFGIGGTFVKEDMATAVRWVNEILPEDKPRHLLGVGEPIDLFLGVENGCDTFDCVAATRMGRNGGLYTKYGKVNILNTKYKNLFEPFAQEVFSDKTCGCYFCQNYSTAYLSHLFRAKEMLAATLASIHNLYFLNSLMSKIRDSILNDNFFNLKEEFLRNYKD